MKFSLGKQEKLKSKKLIQKLFEEGKQIKVFPLKLLYLQTEHHSEFPIQAAFSVPKRNHKKAVARNHIKRLIREVYRKEKPELYNALNKPYVFMFIFMGNEEVTHSYLKEKMCVLLNKFIEKNHNEASITK